jgi:hypothetical protein
LPDTYFLPKLKDNIFRKFQKSTQSEQSYKWGKFAQSVRTMMMTTLMMERVGAYVMIIIFATWANCRQKVAIFLRIDVIIIVYKLLYLD